MNYDELIRICTLLGAILNGTHVDVGLYTEEEIDYCLDLINQGCTKVNVCITC